MAPTVVLADAPESPLFDRSVLVTGGTGSFGNAFVQRALDDGARRIVVFSRDELKQSAMREKFSDPRIRFFVGDVRDADRVTLAMKHVELVVHAAAMKRIEICEAEPSEAIATNITGTQNVAMAAIAAGVDRAIFLSTDKAPCAHTLYGMTKAVGERCWIDSNVYVGSGVTKLSATRYGNVIGSRGSVLELWRRQFAAGQPLTITDARATRFWMTITDAVDLVLLAFREMQGGEVFVPAVGSAPILDLARAIVEINGTYAPGHVETGLRAGERLHETLISEDESRDTTDRGGFYVIRPGGVKMGGHFVAYRSDRNPRQLSVEELRRMVA